MKRLSMPTVSEMDNKLLPTKTNKFALRVTESLLKLAVKLRDADWRINGQITSTTQPPSKIDPGVSSFADHGRFYFSFRNGQCKNLPVQNGFTVTTSGTHIQPVENLEQRKDLTAHVDVADDVADVSEGADISDMYAELHDSSDEGELTVNRQTVSVPTRTGPSLWPLLSSVKASIDTQHVNFINRNQEFYSNYDDSTVAEEYVKPLSSDDVDLIVDNAVDAVLRTRKIWFGSKHLNGVAVPGSLPSTPKSQTPSSSSFASRTPNGSSTSLASGPMVVSKRYAAAIANPRRFKCELCPYSTNNRSHVRRHHISVHSDARPFRCYVCGKEFARSENAKVHMHTRHAGVPYDPERMKSELFFRSVNQDIEAHIARSDTVPSSVITVQPEHITELETKIKTEPGLSEPKIKAEPGTIPINHIASNFPIISSQHLPKPLWSSPLLLGNAGAASVERQRNMNLMGVGGQLPVTMDTYHCPQCFYPCRDAADMLQHLAINHGEAKSFTSTPLRNTTPGFVLLQAAAPLFLLPPTANVLTPKRPAMIATLQPILPKVPPTPTMVAAPTVITTMPAVTVTPVPPVPKAAAVPVPKTPAPAKPTTGSGSTRRERKRRFKTFYCSRCPDRAPFRYRKSFDKHLAQHSTADETNGITTPGKTSECCPSLSHSALTNSAESSSAMAVDEVESCAESSESDSENNFQDDPNDPDFCA